MVEREEENLRNKVEKNYVNNYDYKIIESYSEKYSNSKTVENLIETDAENRKITEQVIEKINKNIQLVIELSQKEKKIDDSNLNDEMEMNLKSENLDFDENSGNFIHKKKSEISEKMVTGGYLFQSLKNKRNNDKNILRNSESSKECSATTSLFDASEYRKKVKLRLKEKKKNLGNWLPFPEEKNKNFNEEKNNFIGTEKKIFNEMGEKGRGGRDRGRV